MKQQQFLNLSTAEEAEDRFWQAVQPQPCGEEQILLENTRERILSRNVIAQHNVPFFDRSNFDGYAVRAEDTFGAQETVQGRVGQHHRSDISSTFITDAGVWHGVEVVRCDTWSG